MNNTLTLDEWVTKNASHLSDDIKIHIKQFDMSEEDQEMLLRLIMISVRQDQQKGRKS